MNTILKKILIVLIIILILALIAYLVYNFFLKKPAEEEEEEPGPGEFPEGEEAEVVPGEEGEVVEIAPTPELKIKPISNEKVLSPTLSADKTKVIYYRQRNGNVWQSAFDGSGLTRISSAVLEDLVDIIWSPDKAKVISVYQNNLGVITKHAYDYGTGKASFLNTLIQEIDWSPASDKILFQYTNEAEDNNHLGISNPDNSDWQNVHQLEMKDVNLDWLGTETEIAFYEKPSGLVPSSLFLFNLLTEELATVLSEVYGMAVKWSPQGDKFILTKTNDEGKNLLLYVSLKDGSTEASINISTFVEKCVWSQDNRSIFCAIPKNISGNEILPDDFYKGIFVSDDDFWKINLETAETTNLIEPWERGEGIYDAVKLFLSPLEDYLFFVDKKDGLLYSIEL